MKEIQAQTLLALVKEHKANCDSECNLSMFSMYPLYEELLGEEEAKKEFKNFI